MHNTVVTIIAPERGGLTEDILARAAALIKAQGVPDVRPVWLTRARAVDLHIPVARPELTQVLRQKFNDFGRFDVFVQTDDVPRQKKIMLADMDATMIEGESLDDIAAEVGVKDKIAPITERAMRGEIDFAEALQERLKILEGTRIDVFQNVLSRIVFSKGGAEAIKVLKRHGTHCVLVSGGFDMFTGAVAASLGFDAHFGNRIVFEQGRLTGGALPPILDKEAKKKILLDLCRQRNVPPTETMAVGDGSNDIPMLQAAGMGIGYFAKPRVVAATPHHIRFTDLTALVYAQGYVID